MFSIVVAVDRNNGIGIGGNLPWPMIKEDMSFFRTLTTVAKTPGKYNAVIMGSKTYLSIPKKFRPLKSRLNVILTRQDVVTFRKANEIPDDVVVANTFDDALRYIELNGDVENVFVAGGSEVYAEAMRRPQCRTLYVTHILEPEYMCDTHLTPIPSCYREVARSEVKKEGDISYQFVSYERSQ
ncbi:Dihydrofolate reductase [Kaumoebavirus]|uniref:Dihydrofolate reductase n=1 Tax=Kaumoebavirus TaxID=1859492 RepID=UPI0009C20F5B|nr:Dihydrofolate reductase [Kaumoebavirus]ARA72137.1 Dihydrofolate reductase [Kaumoebavirus]